VNKQEVAAVLRHYAVLVELLGEDSFRSRAYDNAARMLETQTEDLDTLITQNRLAAVKGIGKGLAGAIVEISARGTFPDLEDVATKVPPGVLELLRVKGLGPKKARALWMEAKVTSLEELEAAIHRGTIEKLPGFGVKTAQKFLAGLEFLRQVSGRHLRHHAHRAADEMRQMLSDIPGVLEVFFGGSLRRGCETVGDLDIVLIAAPEDRDRIRRVVLNLTGMTWNETGEILKGSTAAHFPVDLSVTSPQEAGARKILATGSKDHLRAMREAAAQQKLDLESITGEREEDIYAALGLEFVPPALRESTDAVVPEGSRTFPRALALEDCRGIIHCHTTASDGHNTLREMVQAMIDKGFDFIGIADHSQAAAYARGLTPDRVRAQWKEIDDLNRDVAPFRILKGTEADILADGNPDFDNELLAGFDFVVASVHSGFNMTETEATDRLCRALENPHVDILGHMTGRLLLERNGYPVNHEKVIECAAKHGKAIELNSSPHRLDIDWRWLARCAEAGVPVPLCPDAHIIEGLWEIRYGVEVAAKGPLTAADCPCTWSADQFLDWCQTHNRMSS
jgi:DNA polymerase (family X)